MKRLNALIIETGWGLFIPSAIRGNMQCCHQQDGPSQTLNLLTPGSWISQPLKQLIINLYSLSVIQFRIFCNSRPNRWKLAASLCLTLGNKFKFFITLNQWHNYYDSLHSIHFSAKYQCTVITCEYKVSIY